MGSYRAGLRWRLHPVLRVRSNSPGGPFFSRPAAPSSGLSARRAWRDAALYFGHHHVAAEGPPDWHANPLGAHARVEQLAHWSRIGDFDTGAGDIKTVWEASRFDWLLAMAQRAATGDDAELDRLNAWLGSWLAANPPYLGANWKCGQEASIRVMHLALAAVVTGQTGSPERSLLDLVQMHLKRIAPTISYAIGQQNNHGTSEAAALFIGGSWLASHGERAGQRWARIGRKWLEERARTLIMEDGTFSQYSVVYHRLMLDTYSFAETWRQIMGLESFSAELRGRLRAATWWLRQLTDPESGDAANLGSNDGARILALTDTDYRDFRPSLQWASALFCEKAALAPGPWDQQLHWLGIAPPSARLEAPESQTFDQGGLHILRCGKARAFLRYPRFRFRPSQSDLLHVDFWLGRKNVLRDGGTFSYNSGWDDITYFSGAESHNTAQFDGRDQMPRLGRFLFGSWPRAESVEPVVFADGVAQARAGYRDYRGARHIRSLELGGNALVCRDELGPGPADVVIRWRLQPGEWRLTGNRLHGRDCSIEVESDTSGMKLYLTEGMESRFYLHKTSIPVLEIHLTAPAVVTTRLSF
ncbi:heparinase II/III domain-containing protein [Pelagerythrobacter marensis]|uniref:heparinase II/III domain-containing protein n=1 Tax=Pelagerythrobacter marensis TaxID=543877 RepID=UPI001B802152|nr:heparinase II/III family protein [Pelagerythrobacter marensis]